MRYRICVRSDEKQHRISSLLTSGPHLNGCTDIPLLYRARCNPREMEVLPASLDGAAMMNLLFISNLTSLYLTAHE